MHKARSMLTESGIAQNHTSESPAPTKQMSICVSFIFSVLLPDAPEVLDRFNHGPTAET